MEDHATLGRALTAGFFGSDSWLPGGGAARSARGGTGSEYAEEASLPGREDGDGWSGGGGQDAQPLLAETIVCKTVPDSGLGPSPGNYGPSPSVPSLFRQL